MVQSTLRKLLTIACVASCLPLITTALLFNLAAVVLLDQRKRFQQRRRTSRTVLITGASNVYGLNLARALRKLGHRVVGADTHRRRINIASTSRAIATHYNLPDVIAVEDAAYVGGLIFRIVQREAADLWIDCTQDLPSQTIGTARRLIEQRTSCRILASEGACKENFESREAFFALLQACDLPTPELHKVKSRSQIHDVLNGSQGKKKFALASPEQNGTQRSRTLLPKRTVSQTYSDVALVKIDSSSYMVLEECVDSNLTFKCFALIVHGGVNFFCVHSRTTSEQVRLHNEDSLRRALQSYIERLAHGLDPKFCGHLTLSFGLKERITHRGVVQQMLPDMGTLRIDPEIAMSIDQRGFEEAALAYCSLADNLHNGYISTTIANKRIETPPQISLHRYILLQAITEQLIVPCYAFWKRRADAQSMLTGFVTLCYQLLFSDEAYYDFQDPLPFYWQNGIGLVLSLWH